MGRRKILFFDIDGTLWTMDGHIPESTREAIRKVRENGHLVFINSGRTRGYIRDPKLFSLGLDGIVSGCGTMIEANALCRGMSDCRRDISRTVEDENVIFYRRMSEEESQRVVDIVRRYRMKPILEGRDYLYMDPADFAGDRYADYVRHQMGDALRTISGNGGNWEISKLSCDMKDADKAACFAELEGDYTMIVHNEAVVEMVPKGFDKGTGIREVCALLDTDIQDTYAFGDSMNDFEMIEAAGCGVVMGGGADVVKEKADFVTKELREDGIYYACRELGLL